MTNTVLVTGGAGFIGSHLVQRLVDMGERVRVLERPGATLSHLPVDKVDVVEADIRDRSSVARAVRGCTEVYHLAANPQLWVQQKGLFAQTNFRGAVHVLEEALDAGARRVVHTSSEAILTKPEHATLNGHTALPKFADMPGPYCRAKLRAEQFALQLAKRGAPVIVVSPTLPIGPGDFFRSPPTQMMLDFCRGGRREYVDAQVNMVDVRDVACGMIAAMQRGKPGKRYVLGNETWAIRDLFGALAELMQFPQPDRRVPYWLALTAAYVSEWWADVVSHETPAATVTGVKLSRRTLQYDAAAVWQALGLEPRPIAKTLSEVVQWFRTIGWLSPGSIAS